jgi:hypothetical protein
MMGEQLNLFVRKPAKKQVKRKAKKIKESDRATIYEQLKSALLLCKSVGSLADFWARAVGSELGEDWDAILLEDFWRKADRIGVSETTEKKQVEGGFFPPRPDSVPREAKKVKAAT